MEVGQFNFYRIKMNLDLLSTRADKLKFLFQTKKEIRRIITCFSSNKMVGLRNYAREDIFLEDNCNELMQCLKNIILKYSLDIKDLRYPGEDVLRKEILDEIKKYERFDNLIDIEIDSVKNETKQVMNWEKK